MNEKHVRRDGIRCVSSAAYVRCDVVLYLLFFCCWNYERNIISTKHEVAHHRTQAHRLHVIYAWIELLNIISHQCYLAVTFMGLFGIYDFFAASELRRCCLRTDCRTMDPTCFFVQIILGEILPKDAETLHNEISSVVKHTWLIGPKRTGRSEKKRRQVASRS